ncbi:MAG: chromate efflux transporter, partial [Bacteroidales bacterium]|nr:chromate efflux transporter [Bacteroidales bacterium]
MSVLQIFIQFLKLGSIAFGGPAAHAALMERKLVSERQWLKPQTFLDFLGAVNLIPGPNSTQLCMLTGFHLKGFRGMLAGGVGFILPAMFITMALAWLYVNLGHIPLIESLFSGIQPAVIAVIAGAVVSLGKKALKTTWLGVLGVITLGANLLGINEITAILGAGAVGMAAYAIRSGFKGWKNTNSLIPVVLLQALGAGIGSYSSVKLFWIFFKIGAVLFGTGYVLVAYMDGELVEKAAWITREQLLDAIAIGQFTPGPILTAA